MIINLFKAMIMNLLTIEFKGIIACSIMPLLIFGTTYIASAQIESSEKDTHVNSEPTLRKQTEQSLEISFLADYQLTLLRNFHSQDSLRSLRYNAQITEIKEAIKQKNTDWKTIVVALVALIGSVASSLIISNTNSKNTTMQIEASGNNVTRQLNNSEATIAKQIEANVKQEIHKKQLEIQYNLVSELKENMAKFISLAALLNAKIGSIIGIELEQGNMDGARLAYQNTYDLRLELRNLYYSINVALNNNDSTQVLLESVLNQYINAVHFEFDLNNISHDMYEPLIPIMYTYIKKIVHPNDSTGFTAPNVKE